MTLTELQYIVAVAQEGHFGRAAEKAFVTQPALSLAIKKLEDELGATIFERRRNRVGLTELGERIVHQAQRVLEEAEQIKILAAQGKNQLNGVLRFGVIATVGPYILPDLVPLLNARAPKMPLELEENLTQNLVGMLKSGKLDVIMIALPLEETGILTTALYDEPFQALVPVGHPWQNKKVLDSRQLHAEKVLLPHAGHCFRQQVLDACPELSRSDTGGWQGNSLETIRQMVISGLGITVMPCSALTQKYQNKRLVAIKLAEPVPGRRIGLAWRRGFTRPQVIDVIRAAVQALKIPGVRMISK
ncbi:LysR substrate-binding domain-containing protein [Candidatus Nitrospira inopinata]|jgi:LysR family hydrogen peroxide-inducible transcriptional activator|uniref:Hydrogen peroxide-inducible genes activator n=1 Tax=Candidatus Nitrospira inopinata TaxID=1715989 RepID=A0A0S4KPX4_9BACT|nr:LysR substrate-binding domain-containing protein [Candidatus Nitrospira inopinata]CUQ66407.1 Hydrogen peroxide-inducible genes activator [Candidatus Nitrospira inopinata]